jgi:hypothetical protein
VRLPVATAPLGIALLAVVALIVDPGSLDAIALLLIGLGLLGTATVSVIGMLLVGGIWALWMARLVAAMCLAVAVIRPVDWWWWALVATTATTACLLFLPIPTVRARRVPSALGPPPRAVATPLLLVAAPFAIGLAAWGSSNTMTLVVGLTAPLAALWYSRVLPGGLIGIRLAWPALALAAAPTQSLPAAGILIGLAVAVAILAWHPSVKVAFHPPREVGSVFPIPPELAPSEIREAAHLDERGRSQE